MMLTLCDNLIFRINLQYILNTISTRFRYMNKKELFI